MGVIIGIFVVVFLIWIASNSSSGSSSSHTSNNNSYSNSQIQAAQLLRRQEEQRIRDEQRKQEEERKQEEQRRQEEQRVNARRNFQASLKPNSVDYIQLIRNKSINKLYHFTDRSNIQSIINNGGLCSWHYCEQNRIEIPNPGGDFLSRQLDQRQSLENFVRVSFTRNHPMMYVAKNAGRLNDPVILEINSEVIYWLKTKYSNKNATRNDAHVGGTIEDFKLIKFDVVKQKNHFDLNDEEKPYYQAEILVFEKIPLMFIENIDQFQNIGTQNNTRTNYRNDYIDDLPF